MKELLSDSVSKFPGRFLYNKNIFTDLEKLLAFANSADLTKTPETWFKSLPETAAHFLDICKFTTVWPKILKNTPNSQQKRRWAFHVWFDAFRTLKFIHFCELRNPEKYGRVLNNRVPGQEFTE